MPATRKPAVLYQRANSFYGDIGDSALPDPLVEREHQPRAILNFAAESHVDFGFMAPEDFEPETNIVGTFRLLEAVRAYSEGAGPAPPRKLFALHVSTDEVRVSLLKYLAAFTESHHAE
jgi:dTDP-glucose 4,6-dehydratase